MRKLKSEIDSADSHLHPKRKNPQPTPAVV
jgi:hypothetical protein